MICHSNKKIGTAWERRCCEMLRHKGYWVHFITPDNRGSQPFDIIAVKDGNAKAIDCKTCKSKWFTIERLEDNQVMAFEKWLKCGNSMPELYVLHAEKLFIIPYDVLREHKKIDLTEKRYEVWNV